MKHLSDSATNIILSQLNISSLDDVIDMNYQEIDENNDIDKEKVTFYSKFLRGSIRLRTGRYYTVKEHLERIKRITSAELP